MIIIGIADGSIIAAIIIAHMRKTAIKLLVLHAGDMGIVIIAIGWHISITSHANIAQHRPAKSKTNKTVGACRDASNIKLRSCRPAKRGSIAA